MLKPESTLLGVRYIEFNFFLLLDVNKSGHFSSDEQVIPQENRESSEEAQTEYYDFDIISFKCTHSVLRVYHGNSTIIQGINSKALPPVLQGTNDLLKFPVFRHPFILIFEPYGSRHHEQIFLYPAPGSRNLICYFFLCIRMNSNPIIFF